MGEGTPGRRASAISCGLHRLAEALGDRAHDRVDYAQPEDEPGLRVLVRDEGGSDLLGDDPTDAQKARQCRLMRASQTPSRVLEGLSLYRSFLILAPGAYREGERRDPDPYDEDVGHGGEAGREPDGTEERIRVYDEDKATDGSTHYTCRQYADDIRRNGGGDQTADEQSRNDRPRHLRQAEAEQEADARANGDHELTGIDGADDLARLHTS